jgi:threonine aldolase
MRIDTTVLVAVITIDTDTVITCFMFDSVIVCVRKKLAHMIDNVIAFVSKEISRY